MIWRTAQLVAVQLSNYVDSVVVETVVVEVVVLVHLLTWIDIHFFNLWKIIRKMLQSEINIKTIQCFGIRIHLDPFHFGQPDPLQ